MFPRFDRKYVCLSCSALLLLLLPFLATLAGEPYLVSLFSRILIYALAAASLDLILGYGGLVSLGHAAFFGIGAYAVGILAHHDFEETVLFSWPLAIPGSDNALVAWPVAILVAALLAAIIGLVAMLIAGWLLKGMFCSEDISNGSVTTTAAATTAAAAVGAGAVATSASAKQADKPSTKKATAPKAAAKAKPAAAKKPAAKKKSTTKKRKK